MIQLSSSIQTLCLIPFFLLIITGLTVPSDGNHGMLSIKSLAFISTVLGALGYVLLLHRFKMNQVRLLFFLLATISFLTFWFLIGIIRDDYSLPSTIDQFKIFILTISVIGIAYYYISEGVLTYPKLLKTILLANFAYSLLKIALVAMHLLGVIDLWHILYISGIRFMSMDILGTVPRMQTSIDIATPFLLFFFLQSTKFHIEWRGWFKILFITISSLAIFLSFSRYLIAVGCLSILLHILTLRMKTIACLFILLLACISCGVYLIGYDLVYTIIERRFLSKEVDLSDRTRVVQVEALWKEYLQYPILGKGLGGYTKESIRDSTILHSYEVQWIAFLMQFGMVGLLLILVGVGLIGIQILTSPMDRTKIGLGLLFLVWLLSGFTNPFLISLTSGIIYSLFYLGAKNLQTISVKRDLIT